MLVTIDGFEGGAVTMSVCGNLAARRSMDCNLTGSEARRLNRDGSPTIADLPVAVPPTSCPCVVVASTRGFAELATTPIEIIGHPVGPIVAPEQFEPLVVTVDAKKAPRGILAALRSSLGGPTTYAVTVTVRNPTTATMSNITVAGAAGRSRDDDVADLTFPPIAELAPGQTWTHTVRGRGARPGARRRRVRVTTSGAGPSVTAEESSSSLPVLLVIVALVFLVDVGRDRVAPGRPAPARPDEPTVERQPSPT